MKLLLLGDMSPTRHNFEHFDKMDTEALFGDTKSVFDDGNDFIIVNLEVALTEHDGGIDKFGPCLKAPKNTAHALKKMGVTHCGLSNNHVFDFGKKGLMDTVDALNEAGLEYTGIGMNYLASRKNLIIEKNGEKICIITVCEHEYSYALDDRMGSRPYDVFDTPTDVKAAKEKYDKVIVIYHGGKEHCRYPSPRLVKVCRNLAESGADVVLCQHSHCIGCHEVYNDCHILYGQGNFHFVCEHEGLPGWSTGLMVTYDTDTKEMDFTFIKNNEIGIELVKGDELETLKREFAERNEILAKDEWREKWHEFCESVAHLYIENFTNVFAEEDKWKSYNYVGHAFDCEAHHDVMVELFPTANSTNER